MDGIDFDAWRERIRRDTFANYHRMMGIAIEREGNPTAALDAYRRAIAVDADDAISLYRVVELLVALDRKDEAAEADRQARAIRPDYRADGQVALARHFAEIERIDDGIEVLRTAVRSDPSPVLRRALADMLVEAGQGLLGRNATEAAHARFDEALGLVPEHPDANLQAGLRLLPTLSVARAEGHFRHAVAGLPDHTWARCMLAFTRLMRGAVGEAESLLRQTLPNASEAELGWIAAHLGLTALLRGDIAVAEAWLKRAMAQNLGETIAVNAAAIVARRRNALDLAEVLHRRSVRITPGLSHGEALAGLAAIDRGRGAEGFDLVQRAAQADSGSTLTLMVLAIALDQLGRSDEAQAVHREAVRHQPELVWFLSRLLYWKTESLDAAFRAIGFDPLHPAGAA